MPARPHLHVVVIALICLGAALATPFQVSASPRGRAPSGPEVSGSLDRAIIQRIVRRHRNETRFCYEQALREAPGLSGNLRVSFIISASGAVQSAHVAESTLNNPSMERCVVRAVQRWRFPTPPGGGVVIVTYPFEFRPRQ